MIKNKIKFIIIFVFGILLFSFISAESYLQSNPNYGIINKYLDSSKSFSTNDYYCREGQDFLLQISPSGCIPPVVRSDLLEEQNVPVFCPIVATQINPLIDVNLIESVTYSGEYPKGISGVGFYPSRAALGISKKTNYPILENIGYAIIVLKKQPEESKMPEVIKGTLNAKLRYNAENAFGVGQALLYLPELSKEEFEENKGYYKIWNKYYLKAERIDENSATIGVYEDIRKIASTTLKKGETSQKISLPGFECFANLKLRLDDLTNPGERVKLKINGEVFELVKGQKFLDNKCQIIGIDKQGIIQKIKIKCYTDNKINTSELKITPKIKIQIKNGEDKEKEVGIGEEILGYKIISIDVKKGKEISKENLIVKIKKDNDVKTLTSNNRISINSEDLELLGFASPQNTLLDGSNQKNYDNAIKDYDLIIRSYSNEKCSNFKDCGEKAFIKKITLAKKAKQNKDLDNFCKEFKEKYPESIKANEQCSDSYKLSNIDSDYTQFLINGETKDIFFMGISQSDFEDYGAKLIIDKQAYNLEKNKIVSLQNDGSKEYVQLIELKDNYAKIKIYFKKNDDSNTFINGIYTLKKDVAESFGSSHTLYLKDINFKKYAKISVIPNIDHVKSTGTFNFSIGIEKRAIKLAPDKIQEKINSLDKKITKWEDKSEKLGKMVKTMKTACLTTGGILIAKNFLFNQGESLARKDVMNYWSKKCAKEIKEGKYKNYDNCYASNDEEIDKAVESRANSMEKISNSFSELQKGITKSKWAGLEQEVDDSKVWEKLNSDKTLINNLKNNLEKCYKDKDNRFVDSLSSKYLTITQLRDIMANAEDCATNPYPEIAQENLDKSLSTIISNIKKGSEEDSLKKELTDGGITGFIPKAYADKNSIIGIYYGKTLKEDKICFKKKGGGEKCGDGDEKYPVEIISYKNKKYLIGLEKINDEQYSLKNSCEIESFSDGKIICKRDSNNSIKTLKNDFGYFVLRDSTSYNNPFISSFGETKPVVRYFETEPYKGLPAVVPFDLKHGWYVYVTSEIGFGAGSASYADSGAIRNYYLCNVGQDGIENAMNPDDKCRLINKNTGEVDITFEGLDESETRKLAMCAEDAVRQTARQHGKSQITITTTCGGTIQIDTGSPAVDTPEMQCQNFMSPSDCQILFNVCDPVICPSSRCDFGGRFPVQDVIQSGIVGSLLLCLPNFGDPTEGGVIIPVCLSGLKSGIDGLLSVFKAYRDCLQENLETGKTIGVCDEIYSIYLCEFLWRQALPLAKYSIPKIIEALLGQNTRGGGEYFSFASALTNADNSINYLANYYSADIFKLFKLNSIEEVGTEVCKNYASGAGPKIDTLFNKITEPDSPPQFHGRFDEIPFSTVSVPPTSHYKVFYHIYAGNDTNAFSSEKSSSVYYAVYLKGQSESSYYQDVPSSRFIDSGYIRAGEYVSKTKDFIAPTGYKKLCIRVNTYEECGFKEVSTSFAVDFAKDYYLKSQATETDINSEAECISGTVNLGSVLAGALSPNLEEGADDIIKPKIYERGIIRVCAHNNPGVGTDPKAKADGSRWVDVGWCNKNKEIKCWIDMDSVEKVIKNTEVKEDTLEEMNSHYFGILENTKEIKDANNKLESLETKVNKENAKDIIRSVNEIINNLIMNSAKIRALFLRGEAYEKLLSIN